MKPFNNDTRLFLLPLLFFTLSTFGPGLKAQTAASQVNNFQVQDSVGHLHISFTHAQETSNLLVLIHNSNGEVIFLESKKNFSGTYRKTIDLKAYSPGEVRLNIINDKEKLDKTVTLGK